MIVCDTSIWIEYFRNRDPYFGFVCSLLDSSEILGLECIFGELLQGVTGKHDRKLILECWESIPHFSEHGLWLAAGEYSAIHRLSTCHKHGFRTAGLVERSSGPDGQVSMSTLLKSTASVADEEAKVPRRNMLLFVCSE